MSGDTNFRTGNICRIYMKNFLTYDEVEIFPKPHLNVVIGPNGTGKSSILCGVCIGLSGKPEITGRGKNLAEYVKQGKENAVLEIELFDGDGQKNIIIRREFAGNNSRWYLQNKEVKQKEIEAKVQSLGIQVNNLCQFLPQDRVVEFAKMNKIQLLSSTEMAVGERQLYEHHQILADSGKTIQDKNAKLNELKNQLTTEVQKNDLLKDQARNIERKEELDLAIMELRQVILYSKYNLSREKHNSIREPINKLAQECDTLAKKMEPNQARAAKINDKLERCHQQQKKYDEDWRKHDREMSALDIRREKREEEIVIAEEEFDNLKISNSKREKEIMDLQRQLVVARDQLDNKPINESNINEQHRAAGKEVQTHSANLNKIWASINAIDNEMMNLNVQIDEKNRRLQSVRDNRTSRLQFLQLRNRNVYNAVLWLRDNRHLFKGPVHDPLFLTVEFSNPLYSKYLENTVSKQDLVAFVCEVKYDVKILKTQADANHWPVNILHSSPDSNFQSKYPFDKMRQLGFEAYLKDVVLAPPAVLSYLCRVYRIHEIPFAEEAESGKVPAHFSLFFIGKRRFQRKQSRYDGSTSCNISVIRPPFYLANSRNPVVERELQKVLDTDNQRHAQLLEQQRIWKNEESKVEENLEKLRVEEQSLSTTLEKWKRLRDTVRLKEDLIRKREGNIIDLDRAKQNMHTKIKRATLEMLKTVEGHSKLESEITNLTKKYFCECVTFSEFYEQKKALKREMEDDEEQKRQKEEEKRRLGIEKREHIAQANQLLKDLCASLGLKIHTQVTDQIKTDLTRKISKRTLEELENNFEEKTAYRKCIITSDNSVLLEFQKRKVKIAELQKREEEIRNTMEVQKESVESSRHYWLPKITDLISKINCHFADFMSQLDCAGEVQLDIGNDEEDFSQYGLAIRVKFRDAEKLKELTVHQQSGGERSISTALFLMALQTLTPVPFRCVDEINQGMDPTNERKMFTMLVQTTTTETASQYFLITPKLLPNLPYNRRVSFLNIISWSSLSTTRHLNVAKVLAYYKKRNNARRVTNHRS